MNLPLGILNIFFGILIGKLDKHTVEFLRLNFGHSTTICIVQTDMSKFKVSSLV